MAHEKTNLIGAARRWLDFNVTTRNNAVADWAKSMAPDARVVDIGAGTCSYAPLFAHCDYVAQDHPAVDYAPTGSVQIRSDICAIPLPPASVDGILCTEVLEHVEQPLAAIDEFSRLLKPGGKLMLSVPAACRVHRVPTHYYGGFAPDFFETSIPARGLKLEQLVPVGNWSRFMAQEMSRLPSIVRSQTKLPKSIGLVTSIALWPIFRLLAPFTFAALARIDATDDLPLGWIAYAVKR